jgi:hypothetical protein
VCPVRCDWILCHETNYALSRTDDWLGTRELFVVHPVSLLRAVRPSSRCIFRLHILQTLPVRDARIACVESSFVISQGSDLSRHRNLLFLTVWKFVSFQETLSDAGRIQFILTGFVGNVCVVPLNVSSVRKARTFLRKVTDTYQIWSRTIHTDTLSQCRISLIFVERDVVGVWRVVVPARSSGCFCPHQRNSRPYITVDTSRR